MSLVYVYALTGAPARRPAGEVARAFRAGGRRIHLMPVGSLHAAVERIDAPPALSEAALRAQHALVSRLSRRFDAILPARFGAAVDPVELRRVVLAREKTLARALEAVKGCDQMTIRIFGPPPPGRGVPARSVRTGTAYLRGRREAARAVMPPFVRRIRRAVKPVVLGERIDPGGRRVLASVHHLVPRALATRYRSLVQDVVADLPPRSAAVTGPWPPFAFTPDIWP